MDPDPLQEAWQSQPEPAIDADRLVQEFRRGEQQFAAMIFWRDVREVGVSLLLLPVWVAMGVGIGLPWTWYLVMPGIVWIAAFMTADRMHSAAAEGRAGRAARPGGEELPGRGRAPDLAAPERALVVPPAAGRPDAGVLRPHLLAASRGNVWEAAIATSLAAVIVGGVYGWVYWLNQKAVRSTLEPRQRELQGLLKSLKDEFDEV